MSDSKRTISLKKAIKYTTEWRDDESDYNKYNKCNAFLVPIGDLMGLLEEMQDAPKDSYVRAYLGVKKTKNDDGSLSFEEKLVFVGTTQEKGPDGHIIYRDIILPGAENAADGENTGLYDFTVPCPPQCDPNSKLN